MVSTLIWDLPKRVQLFNAKAKSLFCENGQSLEQALNNFGIQKCLVKRLQNMPTTPHTHLALLTFFFRGTFHNMFQTRHTLNL